MRPRHAVQAGITMLEIVVTMFLVLVGLLVVTTSFIAIAKSHRYSEQMDIATTIARAEMERLRNRPFAQIRSETGSYGEYPEHPGFRHAIVVTTVGNVKHVVLQVLFENDRRHAELRTYIADL